MWVLAMAALVHRDVLPFWTAQETPRPALPTGNYQVSIRLENGKRVGTTWINTTTSSQSTMVRSMTVLDAAGLVPFLPLSGAWTMHTDLTYDGAGILNDFSFSLAAPGLNAEVSAERLEHDYSCIARFGTLRRTMLLDGDLSQYLCESLRPFTHLSNLRIGQSWRIRVLDPVALIKSQSLDFTTQLARVTRREVIRQGGKESACFRIETPAATAWADDKGLVIRQEVQPPWGGRWVMEDEPYDSLARRAAMSGRPPRVSRRSMVTSRPGN